MSLSDLNSLCPAENIAIICNQLMLVDSVATTWGSLCSPSSFFLLGDCSFRLLVAEVASVKNGHDVNTGKKAYTLVACTMCGLMASCFRVISKSSCLSHAFAFAYSAFLVCDLCQTPFSFLLCNLCWMRYQTQFYVPLLSLS